MEHLSKHLINWASILEPKTREQALTTASMPFVYPHLALMPDAHLGKGATVGSVIPTLERDHPGRGRRGHRLRHDRGPDPVHPRRPDRALDPARQAARRDRTRGPAVGRRATTQKMTATAAARSRARQEGGRRPDSTRAGYARQLGRPARFARFGQPLHRGDRRRARPGVAVPALGFARCRQQDRPAPHQASPSELCERWWITLPDRDLAYLVGGHRRVLALHPRTAVGAGLRPAQPRGDDGPGRRLRRASGIGAEVVEHERINCHHNYTEQENALRQGGVVVPQGRHRRRGRPARPDPGLDGHRELRGDRQGQPGRAELLAARRRPQLLAVGGAASRSPATQLRAAMKGIEYRDTDAFIDEIPQAYKPIDQVMAGRGRPGRGAARAAAAGQRQGRLNFWRGWRKRRPSGSRSTGPTWCCAPQAVPGR